MICKNPQTFFPLIYVKYFQLNLGFVYAVSDAPNLPEQFLEKAAEKSDESKKDMASQCAEMTDYIGMNRIYYLITK